MTDAAASTPYTHFCRILGLAPFTASYSPAKRSSDQNKSQYFSATALVNVVHVRPLSDRMYSAEIVHDITSNYY